MGTIYKEVSARTDDAKKVLDSLMELNHYAEAAREKGWEVIFSVAPTGEVLMSVHIESFSPFEVTE